MNALTINRPIRKLTRLMVMAAIPWILAGCNEFLVNTHTAPLEEPVAFDSLGWYRWVGSAPLSDLNRERLRLEHEVEATNGIIPSVQLAVILSDARVANQEAESEARRLLARADRRCFQQRFCADYVAFGELLQDMLKQRARLQIAEADWRRERENVQRLQDQIRRLEQQIQDLTTIEQQLMEREQIQQSKQ